MISLPDDLSVFLHVTKTPYGVFKWLPTPPPIGSTSYFVDTRRPLLMSSRCRAYIGLIMKLLPRKHPRRLRFMEGLIEGRSLAVHCDGVVDNKTSVLEMRIEVARWFKNPIWTEVSTLIISNDLADRLENFCEMGLATSNGSNLRDLLIRAQEEVAIEEKRNG